MSIFIIAVLIFVYFYCSALEAAMEPMEPMEVLMAITMIVILAAIIACGIIAVVSGI